MEARSELDFDGKSHTHLLVGGCEICLHTQLTDSPPPNFEFKKGTVHFSKHCVLLGILDDTQKSSDILNIYSISKFLERQNYLNIRSSGMLGHVDC